MHPDCFLIINKDTAFESKIKSDEYVQSLSISFDSNFIGDMFSNLKSSTTSLLDNHVVEGGADFIFPETLLPLRSNLLFNLNHIKYYIKNNLNDYEESGIDYMFAIIINWM